LLYLLWNLTFAIVGPNHQWLNYRDGQSFSQDGIFLVLVNACFGDPTFIGHRERIIMYEKVKMLQQRYFPCLCTSFVMLVEI